jgi:hypothetical protein
MDDLGTNEMSGINWREAMAWPMSQRDREDIEQLRRKEITGEELTPQERKHAEAIIRIARAGVRDEAAERRLQRPQTVEEMLAEIDRL